MAFTYLGFNRALPLGSFLSSALKPLEDGRNALFQVIATMQTTIDQDGSLPQHFTNTKNLFGFASDQAAMDGWNELLSLKSKLDTDASVTNVFAAMNQAFAKFRS